MYKTIKNRIVAIMFSLIFAAGLFCYGSDAQGTTINAASCSYADVSEAITAASPGDTVMVPAGNCTWSSGVSIPNDKKITLQGAGMDATVITGSGVNMTQSGSRVTGFGFILNELGGTSVDGDGWRIDHCRFYSASFFNSKAVHISGQRENNYPTGLIDNCVFFNSRVMIYGWAGLVAHGLWAQPLNLGSGDNVVYVEDCTFNFDVFGNAIDEHYGGRYVFRYNTVNDVYIEAHSIKGASRSARKWEIYNNTINQIDRGVWVPILLRGGTGVVFDNIVTGTWGNPNISLDNARSYDIWDDECGRCDGTSPWDGNEGTGDEAGYPCRDQIGRSTDQWLWTDANPYPPQALAPAYAWNNKHGANEVAFFQHSCAASHAHIQPNRDYYNYDVSFNGTSGVGFGTLADRPTTCTTNVSYWATDQGEWNSENPGPDGQLYKCTSTDTWELYYIPYTYPHPLRGESDTSTTSSANSSLKQNYPNPFTLSTKIEYSVVYACNVQIKIYNRLGQEVYTLVDEDKKAGEYSIIWDGKDEEGNKLTSGLYYYKLTAGNQSATKKMIFLR